MRLQFGPAHVGVCGGGAVRVGHRAHQAGGPGVERGRAGRRRRAQEIARGGIIGRGGNVAVPVHGQDHVVEGGVVAIRRRRAIRVNFRPLDMCPSLSERFLALNG